MNEPADYFDCSHVLYPSFSFSFFRFSGMGKFGALGRSSELISVLEILFHSLYLGEMCIKGCQEIDCPKKRFRCCNVNL